MLYGSGFELLCRLSITNLFKKLESESRFQMIDGSALEKIDSDSSSLRILASYEAKIAKICNSWTSRPVIQLINHLFKLFLPHN